MTRTLILNITKYEARLAGYTAKYVLGKARCQYCYIPQKNISINIYVQNNWLRPLTDGVCKGYKSNSSRTAKFG